MPTQEMAQEFRQVIDELRRKDKADLTEDQLAFLAARRSYLTVDERIYFGFEQSPATPEVEPEAPAVPKSKKVK